MHQITGMFDFRVGVLRIYNEATENGLSSENGLLGFYGIFGLNRLFPKIVSKSPFSMWVLKV